jgi:hypothetical protein
MPSYRVSTATSARPDTVWRLLIDGRSWPRWASGIDELVEARSSGLDPHGHDDVGTVRVFRSGRTFAGERLTELVENREPMRVPHEFHTPSSLHPLH